MLWVNDTVIKSSSKLSHDFERLQPEYCQDKSERWAPVRVSGQKQLTRQRQTQRGQKREYQLNSIDCNFAFNVKSLHNSLNEWLFKIDDNCERVKKSVHHQLASC